MLRNKNEWLLRKWTAEQPNLLAISKHRLLLKGRIKDETFLTMLRDYKNLRGEKPLYDGYRRTALSEQNIAQMLTNFHTNVTTHAYARVRNYVTRIVGKNYNEADKNTQALFTENERPAITNTDFNWDYNLFPIYSIGRKHIHYNTTALEPIAGIAVTDNMRGKKHEKRFCLGITEIQLCAGEYSQTAARERTTS